MSETASIMIPLGTIAPDFQLYDVITEEKISLHELKSNVATVIMFICNHCPYVKLILPTLVQMIKAYQQHHIQFAAISSNDIEAYPADAPTHMRQLAQTLQFSFPYLYDETQMVAKNYHAVCTPDFFVFDNQLKCVYRGRFDDATPGNKKSVTGNDLRAALDHIINGTQINMNQHPSLGCNIKWKKHN